MNTDRHRSPLLLPLFVMIGISGASGVPAATGPAFDCDAAEDGSIERLVCDDAALSALDRTLSQVCAAAGKKAHNEHPPVLKAEQRGWVKGRNDCWKSDDQRQCVLDAYNQRIVELQARYRLVPSTGPVRYTCGGDPRNAVIATYFKTEPPTLIAERGDSTSFMILQPSGSGAKYQGRNESLWEHQGSAEIIWGYATAPMQCEAAK